jgi:hypothetical protein
MIKHALEVAVCARKRSAYDARMTRRLIGLFGIFCALVASPLSAQARGLRVAIFDFELIDTSLEGATNGPRADETVRLVRLGDQLRMLVTSSGKLEVIDIAPVRAEQHKASLQACGGCDADLAQRLGAELSITGTVQKVSNLILNIKSLRPCRSNESAFGRNERGHTRQHGRVLVARARISGTHAFSAVGEPRPAIAAGYWSVHVALSRPSAGPSTPPCR